MCFNYARLIGEGDPEDRPQEEEAQAIGKSRGGWTSKLHTRCDAHGNLIEIVATGGNVSDYTAAPALVENCNAEYLIGDKGYDSNTIREAANARGISDQIPTRKNNGRPNAPPPSSRRSCFEDCDSVKSYE